MSTLYVESSALLAWMFGESDGEGLGDEFKGATTVVTSALTFLEAERALLRAEATTRRRGAKTGRALRGFLARMRGSSIVLGIDDGILARAALAFPVEPVRALDAIHLASAARFAEAYPDLRILTRDRRIAENAEALGLS